MLICCWYLEVIHTIPVGRSLLFGAVQTESAPEGGLGQSSTFQCLMFVQYGPYIGRRTSDLGSSLILLFLLTALRSHG